MAAKYGRSGGGVITVATRSGTSTLHFGLFEYFKNPRSTQIPGATTGMRQESQLLLDESVRLQCGRASGDPRPIRMFVRGFYDTNPTVPFNGFGNIGTSIGNAPVTSDLPNVTSNLVYTVNPTTTVNINLGFGQKDVTPLGLPNNSGNAISHSFSAATTSPHIGVFAQDDWKVSRKPTVNLGLRWDVDVPRAERYNRLNHFDLNAPSPLAGKVPGFSNLKGAWVLQDANRSDG